MNLHLFDTATRSVREFIPLTPGKVGIYLCGATVQSSPHIGHVRTVVAFDVLVRWLRRSDLDVTVVRNVTDIDDKILSKSAAAGEPWWQWGTKYDREFTAAYDALGALPPEHEPRATGHITDMVELVERLIASGHAYSTGPGNVYFDVRSWPEYGALTNQRLDDLAPVNDGDGSGKRDPRDFALWKAPREGEPETASWPTPFGRGRPGWHLECSAMATRYLGPVFDIHGGGLDLRFPHHENEQAQSQAAGDGFAQYWLHSAWVTQGGTKMSKSLGNGLLVSEVLQRTKPAVLRYALTAVHYRSMLEWTDSTLGEVPATGQDTLVEAEAIWDRLAGFVTRAQERVGVIDAETLVTYELPEAFVTAMNDDLNVPSALAVVHEHLRAGNTALATSDDQSLAHHVTVVRAMLDVLGLDPAGDTWGQTHADDGYRNALATLIAARLQERADARINRDFAAADAIRDSLAAAGIVIEDGPAGARWTLNTDQAG